MPDPDPPTPPSPDDPRLAIPEVLRKPPAGAPTLEKKDGRKDASQTLQMGRAWAMAMDFVFTIIAGAALGWLFDRWRGTAPTGAAVGLGLGFVLAFYRIVRATQKQEAAEKRAREEARRK